MFSFLLRLLIYALAVFITSHLIPGICLVSPWWSLLIAAVLIMINTIVKPFMIILTLPASLFMLAVFIVVVNALAVLFLNRMIDGFTIDSFWSALAFSIVFSLMQPILAATGEREEN